MRGETASGEAFLLVAVLRLHRLCQSAGLSAHGRPPPLEHRPPHLSALQFRILIGHGSIGRSPGDPWPGHRYGPRQLALRMKLMARNRQRLPKSDKAIVWRGCSCKGR